MASEYDQISQSLRDANNCYLAQVGENEELKKQLRFMQTQHEMMLNKFAQFEEKLQ